MISRVVKPCWHRALRKGRSVTGGKDLALSASYTAAFSSALFRAWFRTWATTRHLWDACCSAQDVDWCSNASTAWCYHVYPGVAWCCREIRDDSCLRCAVASHGQLVIADTCSKKCSSRMLFQVDADGLNMFELFWYVWYCLVLFGNVWYCLILFGFGMIWYFPAVAQILLDITW